MRKEIQKLAGILSENEIKREKIKSSDFKKCTCGKNFVPEPDDLINREYGLWYGDIGSARMKCKKCGGYISVEQYKQSNK